MMFHVRDGLYFERADEAGSVRIVKRASHEPGAPVVFEVVLDAHSWMSVLTEVSFDPGQMMPLANELHRGIGQVV